MDYWDKPLPLAIMPESGPLPLMVSLLDVNRALIGKLPQGYLKRPHWMRAGQALVIAAETGESQDLELAFKAIVDALVREGWLKRGVSLSEPVRSEAPRLEPLCSVPPRSELPRSEPLRSDPPRFEQPRAEPPSSERPSFEPPRTELLRSVPLRSEAPGSVISSKVGAQRSVEPLWRRIRPNGRRPTDR